MKRLHVWPLISFCWIMMLLGCNKDGNFLYYVENARPPELFNFKHKIKEIEGESRVDVMWVIDNSGSMGDYQQAVITNANLFIQQFTKLNLLDWRMAVISTDEIDQPFVGMRPGDTLDRSTPNAVGVFQQAVGRLGINGAGYEKTFTPILKALASYPQFVRRDAILAFIFVTDAEEQSRINFDDFMKPLLALKGAASRMIGYGVFAAKDLGCQSSDSTWNYVGSPYEQFIKPLQGKVYPLCSPDFGTNLADLGKDLISRIQRPKLKLQKRPDTKTLHVYFKGKELPGGPKSAGGYWIYDYNLNALLFHDLEFADKDIEEVQVVFAESV